MLTVFRAGGAGGGPTKIGTFVFDRNLCMYEPREMKYGKSAYVSVDVFVIWEPISYLLPCRG